MSIGDTLARARQDAGLSITQVSQRTRIRETIIRGIEDDDFSPCGGDFYARGHIRSVAKAVGVDPGPLIQEYDEAHGGLGPVSAAEVFEPATPIKIRERRPPNWSAAMALAVVAVIVYAVVHAFVGTSHHVSNAAAESGRPAASASAKPSPSPDRHRAASSARCSFSSPPPRTAGSACTRADGTHPAGHPLVARQATFRRDPRARENFTHRVSMEIGQSGRHRAHGETGHRMNLAGSQVTTLSFRPGAGASG